MSESDKPITLDGTYGAGTITQVKIYTRIPGSTELKEETFEVPYLFLDIGRIASMHLMNLFAGFTLVNEGKPNQLKELGL